MWHMHVFDRMEDSADTHRMARKEFLNTLVNADCSYGQPRQDHALLSTRCLCLQLAHARLP